MNAKELADSLVEAGILWFDAFDECYMIAAKADHKSSQDTPLTDNPVVTVNDWRVAGKVLESMTPVQRWRLFERWGIGNDPLAPRAINEAWYEARQ